LLLYFNFNLKNYVGFQSDLSDNVADRIINARLQTRAEREAEELVVEKAAQDKFDKLQAEIGTIKLFQITNLIFYR
jgi:hypothetical protein